ncbi:hypothetical protein AJ79_04650 [Helicocarpus griseus UAMH5409]|uniref:Nucleoside phosphorylase domain-containing protein n=1 Tax=Helicocarpus griseus UAMH5409 TaxID=1447875 RepID=A0A2B7XSW4_9EURO|nr:hypothetical protein AJ79_04650 [Helicocarpus griseus UAMH5409]
MSQKQFTGRRLTQDDYTVACICPMGVELAPVEAMLDETHQSLPTSRDHNCYTLGRIGEHNVVIAVMPEIGNNIAATVATQLLNEFRQIRFGLLVGVGGGIPSQNNDIRLGDVVGQDISKWFIRANRGFKKPPALLMASVQKLESQHIKLGTHISQYLRNMLDKYPNMAERGYIHPGINQDHFFEASYNHIGDGDTCEQCDQNRVSKRVIRKDLAPVIHYGTIGSSNEVIKDGITRDKLREDLGILCIETEAAGLMDDFSCLVIRGICDYADSHKNKIWQPYAAFTAAAYAKELLSIIPAQKSSGIAATVEILVVSDYPKPLQTTKPPIPQNLDSSKKQIYNVAPTYYSDSKPKKKEPSLAPKPSIAQNVRDNDLCDAIIAKDAGKVARLLAAGANPNSSKEYYGCALTQAIKRDFEIARLLTEAGAEINSPLKKHSPLQNAVDDYGDKVDGVQLLLDCGADVDGPEEDRGGPLNRAAEQGKRAKVRLLLEKGANVHLPERGAALKSALKFSSHFTHRIEMVQLLCNAGADSSRLSRPAQAQVKWILNNTDQAVNPWHGTKISWEEQKNLDDKLKCAVRDGKIIRIKQLWTAGANVDQHTVMEEALRGNLYEVVSLLLELGAYMPSLMIPASYGYIGMIQSLINRGAEVNPKYGGGSDWPLYAAASAGLVKTSQLLIDNGADVNYKSSRRDSALSAAALQGYAPVVQLLVDNKADVNAANPDHFAYGTALIAAAFWAQEDCVRILIQAGADVNKIVDKELFCTMAAVLEPYPYSLYKKWYTPKVREPKTDAKIARIVRMLWAAGVDTSILSSKERARVEAYLQVQPWCVLM